MLPVPPSNSFERLNLNNNTAGVESPFEKFSDFELVQRLKAPTSLVIGSSEDRYNEAVMEELGLRIQDLFDSIVQSVATMAEALEPLFQAAEGDESKLTTLAFLTLSRSQYMPSYVAKVLEATHFSDEDKKFEILTKACTLHMVGVGFQYYTSQIKLGNAFHPIYYIKLDMEKIFGIGTDAIVNPNRLPNSLAMGIAIALEKRSFSFLQQALKDPSSKIIPGFIFEISQTASCTFPGSLLAPLLPYLCELEGLVTLRMLYIGHYRNLEYGTTDGFDNHEGQILLQILNTNPTLLHLDVNDSDMDEDFKANFRGQLKTTLSERRAKLTKREDILATYEKKKGS